MRSHNFDACLEYSHRASVEGIFDAAYREWFPDLQRIELAEDMARQRRGIDKVLHFAAGNSWTVDEKMRKEDYGDILIETISVFQNNQKVKKGWIYTCQCDFIVYGIEPTRKAYLLPVPLLKKAWLKNHHVWEQTHRSVTARNERNGSRWETISTAVPIRDLLDAIRLEMIRNFHEKPESGGQMSLFDFKKPALYQAHEYSFEEIAA